MTSYPTAWSYSRWAVWTQCPLKYKLQVVDKAPFVSSPAMERGNRIHIGIAAYLDGKAQEMPEEVKSPYFKDLVASIGAWPDKLVEKKWAFNRRWQSCAYFAKDTWLRAILDVMLVYEDASVEAVDWKTGRRYAGNDDQMELFALVTMWKVPSAKTVTTRLSYIDTKDTEEIVDWNASDRLKLTEKWEGRVDMMMSDREFGPRPNDKCKWCQFGRDKGGPCFYG